MNTIIFTTIFIFLSLINLTALICLILSEMRRKIEKEMFEIMYEMHEEEKTNKTNN